MSNMVVRTNVFALNAHRNMKNVGLEQGRASNRLSSGFRINSAADDAAGLAISETMRAQIRGLDQASRNAQDGQAMLLTTEGGLEEIGNMLQRVRELLVQASNDTNTQNQRVMIEQEVRQLSQEIASMQQRVEFNTNRVLAMGPAMDSVVSAEVALINEDMNVLSDAFAVVNDARTAVNVAMEILRTMPPLEAASTLNQGQMRNLEEALAALDWSSVNNGDIADPFQSANMSGGLFDGTGAVAIAAAAAYTSTSTDSMPADLDATNITQAISYLETRMSDLDALASRLNEHIGDIHNNSRTVFADIRNFAAFRAVGGAAEVPAGYAVATAAVDRNAAQGSWTWHAATIAAVPQFAATVALPASGSIVFPAPGGGTVPGTQGQTAAYGVWEVLFTGGAWTMSTIMANATYGYDVAGAFTHNNGVITAATIFTDGQGRDWLFVSTTAGAQALGLPDGAVTGWLQVNTPDVTPAPTPANVPDAREWTFTSTDVTTSGGAWSGAATLIVVNVGATGAAAGPAGEWRWTQTASATAGVVGTTVATATIPAVDPTTGAGSTGDNVAFFQVGANANQGITFDFETVSRTVTAAASNVTMVATLLSNPDAGSGIGRGISVSPLIAQIQGSLDDVNNIRANLGAVQNRLDYTMRSLDISSENLSNSESRVRDADIAREMMRFTMANVLQQAAVSMLAQANQLPNNLLQLLR